MLLNRAPRKAPSKRVPLRLIRRNALVTNLMAGHLQSLVLKVMRYAGVIDSVNTLHEVEWCEQGLIDFGEERHVSITCTTQSICGQRVHRIGMPCEVDTGCCHCVHA